jgi:hypothetical protein
MKLLKEIVKKQGINFDGKAINREAVRGVIIKNNKLLMIYSSKDGEYKFPGGGIDIGEAISINKMLMESNCFPRWTQRETFVLEHVKEKFFASMS